VVSDFLSRIGLKLERVDERTGVPTRSIVRPICDDGHLPRAHEELTWLLTSAPLPCPLARSQTIGFLPGTVARQSTTTGWGAAFQVSISTAFCPCLRRRAGRGHAPKYRVLSLKTDPDQDELLRVRVQGLKVPTIAKEFVGRLPNPRTLVGAVVV
jgi:hypothetical protein